MKKAKFIVIHGDRKHTALMQAGDVFSKDKVLGSMQVMEVEYKTGEVVTFRRAGKLIEEFKTNLEKLDRIVTLVHLSEIYDENKILLNNNKVKPYINKSVRMVSDGTKWGMLHEILTHED